MKKYTNNKIYVQCLVKHSCIFGPYLNQMYSIDIFWLYASMYQVYKILSSGRQRFGSSIRGGGRTNLFDKSWSGNWSALSKLYIKRCSKIVFFFLLLVIYSLRKSSLSSLLHHYKTSPSCLPSLQVVKLRQPEIT